MYVIDGHNLIPKIPGLSLEALDDEQDLIRLLQNFARVSRQKEMHVFFDKAGPGRAGMRGYGAVRAHFVPQETIADEAIRRFVTQLGKAAKNVTVVSSDYQVQANARALHARVISSEEFAGKVIGANQAFRPESAADGVEKPEKGSPVGENWLELFGLDEQEAGKPIELGKREKSRLPKIGAKKTLPKSRRHHGFSKKPGSG